MPTPEARAAFGDAQKLATQMHQLHEHEEALKHKLNEAVGEEAIEGARVELDRVRKEWARLFKDYSNAMQRYTLAVETGRKGQ